MDPKSIHKKVSPPGIEKDDALQVNLFRQMELET